MRRSLLPKPMPAPARALGILAILSVAGALSGFVRPDDAASRPPEPATFAWFEIWIDSGDLPLAAWQAELKLLTPGGRIVGIEGGEPTAFREPPYYDPRALRAERAVLAAFSTAMQDSLPRGRCRVATVHVEIPGGAEPAAALVFETAAGPDGIEFQATATAIHGR